MTSRERTLVRTVVAVGLAGACAWGYARLVAARDSANDAAENLAESRALAAQIKARQSGGAAVALAGADEPNPSELIRRIESAAKAADLPPSAVERIEPAPLRQLDGAEEGLREKPTSVQLRGVTLKELFTFLHAAGGGGRESGLRLSDVRLTAPSPDDTGDRWQIEGTLTYLVRAATPTERPRD